MLLCGTGDFDYLLNEKSDFPTFGYDDLIRTPNMDELRIHEAAKAAVQGTLAQARGPGIDPAIQQEAIAVGEHILKCLEMWENTIDGK